MLPENTTTNTAVFIDYENIFYYLKNHQEHGEPAQGTETAIRKLKRKLETELNTKVILMNAYADFERVGSGSLSTLYLLGVSVSNVLGSAHKNAADMKMCVDIMETLYTRNDIHRFVIVAGDRDYIPVVQQLKRLGKQILVAAIPETMSGDLLEILGEDNFIHLKPCIEASVAPVPEAQPVLQEVAVTPDLPVVEETQPYQDEPITFDPITPQLPFQQRRPATETGVHIHHESLNLHVPDQLTACLLHILIFINRKITFKPGIVQILRYLTEKMPQIPNYKRKILIEQLQGLNVIQVVRLQGQEYEYSAIEINAEHEMVQDALDMLESHAHKFKPIGRRAVLEQLFAPAT